MTKETNDVPPTETRPKLKKDDVVKLIRSFEDISDQVKEYFLSPEENFQPVEFGDFLSYLRNDYDQTELAHWLAKKIQPWQPVLLAKQLLWFLSDDNTKYPDARI